MYWSEWCTAPVDTLCIHLVLTLRIREGRLDRRWQGGRDEWRERFRAGARIERANLVIIFKLLR